MKPSELEFKEIAHFDQKEVVCNCCGVAEVPFGWYSAEIFIAENATWDVFICSDDCMDTFIQHPLTESLLDERTAYLTSLHQMIH